MYVQQDGEKRKALSDRPSSTQSLCPLPVEDVGQYPLLLHTRLDVTRQFLLVKVTVAISPRALLADHESALAAFVRLEVRVVLGHYELWSLQRRARVGDWCAISCRCRYWSVVILF